MDVICFLPVDSNDISLEQCQSLVESPAEEGRCKCLVIQLSLFLHNQLDALITLIHTQRTRLPDPAVDHLFGGHQGV